MTAECDKHRKFQSTVGAVAGREIATKHIDPAIKAACSQTIRQITACKRFAFSQTVSMTEPIGGVVEDCRDAFQGPHRGRTNLTGICHLSAHGSNLALGIIKALDYAVSVCRAFIRRNEGGLACGPIASRCGRDRKVKFTRHWIGRKIDGERAGITSPVCDTRQHFDQYVQPKSPRVEVGRYPCLGDSSRDD